MLEHPTLVAWGASAALAMLAALSWLAARRLARRTGLASAAGVIASDVGRGNATTLYDDTHRLYGKPDYLLRQETPQGIRLVPVEVKPTRRSTWLYEGDEMELVVYAMLVRANYPNSFAGYGLVRYADATFRVALTEERERRGLTYAAQVRAARQGDAASVHRSHSVPARCAGCGVREACGEALA